MRMARNFTGLGALGGVFLLAACSDPVPPAAQAGISIHMQEYDGTDPNHPQADCPPYRHWVNVPYQRESNTQTQQTSANESKMTAVNNQNGDKVSCIVQQKDNGFYVRGEAYGYASDDKNMIKRKPTIVYITIPKISQGDTGASGSLRIQDDNSLNPYSSDECSYSVSGEGSLGIDPGSVWAKVMCHNLKDPQAPGANCHVDTGYFLLENCTQ